MRAAEVIEKSEKIDFTYSTGGRYGLPGCVRMPSANDDLGTIDANVPARHSGGLQEFSFTANAPTLTHRVPCRCSTWNDFDAASVRTRQSAAGTAAFFSVIGLLLSCLIVQVSPPSGVSNSA